MKQLLSRKISGTHAPALIMGVFTVVSQLLALVRDRIFAESFGSGYVLDVYYSAFRIPDLLFIMLGSIVSISVLVPFFSHSAEQSDEELRRSLSQIVLFFGLISSIIVILAGITMPYLVELLFHSESARFIRDVTSVSRVMLLSPLLLGLSSIVTSLLQVRGQFILSSLQPVVYNIGIILGGIVLYPQFGIVGLGMGVALGACLHVALPFIIAGSAMKITITHIPLRMLVKRVVSPSLPRTLSLSLSQILTTLGLTVVVTAGAGAITRLTWAQNIYSVPLSVIGVSYSLSAFAFLSRLVARGELEEFDSSVTRTARWVLFLTIPLALLLIIFSEQVVLLLLGGGGSRAPEITGSALSILAIGLPTACVSLVLIRSYYAKGNTLIPFLTQLIGFCVGLVTLTIIPHNEQGIAQAFLMGSLAVDISLITIGLRHGSIQFLSSLRYIGTLLMVWIPLVAGAFWAYFGILTMVGGNSTSVEIIVAILVSACTIGVGEVFLRKRNLPEYEYARSAVLSTYERVRTKLSL